MFVQTFLKDLNQIFRSRKFAGNFEKWKFRVNLLKQKYQTINEHKKKVSGYTNSFRFIDNLSKKPNYITATVTETVVPNQKPEFDDKELNAAEKKMPGLKQFLRIEE